jgi:peptidoglycan/LPS O-acetylase OafA/YrhL
MRSGRETYNVGIFRVVLALCVLVEHSGSTIFGLRPMPGFLALQTFYILSGFYMHLVLSERYKQNVRAFYFARLRRLYPIYWIVALATAAFVLLTPPRCPNYGWFCPGLDWIDYSLGIVANITMVGLDWLRLTYIKFGHLMIDTRLQAPFEEPSFPLFLVSPAWSIGLELTFYAVAPWLARRRTSVLLGLFVLSFALRAYGYEHGLNGNRWTDGFFPFELGNFLAGMLAFRIYASTKPQFRAAGVAMVGALSLIAIFALGKGPEVVFGWGPLWNWAFLASVAATLPFVFGATRNSRLDRFLGEYSYPIYISHYLIMSILQIEYPWTWGTWYFAPLVMTITLLVSAILLRVTESGWPFTLRTAGSQLQPVP